ncbi:YhjD/YihY/BrkB family envelope integrity protein [Actinomycetospora straminea]|uniref:YihY family inner membrane protein n=1 Tax=Actinomycetospora straminea TaxID=663607 RepID=A0ABP9EE26_9PSEU|nr:YhjD/YihY/BrkB family envelope integrity protein [Actinomycetospora straminea]MDD7935609.1 YhjD/YihY/BrkB family envelope integrity protein [Actinomycetospora straminea]
MTTPTGPGPASGVPPPWRDRLRDTRTRYEASSAGRLTRRIVDVQLTKQALLLAALALMLVVPALVTLAAVMPLGGPDSPVSGFVRRLGLTPQAAHDLQQLFPTTTTVSGATTGIGLVLTVVLTVRWPLALQRGYELVWDLPRGSVRALWRPLVWLLGFLAIIATAALVDPVLYGGAWLVTLLVVGTPLTVAWAWWTQYLLLAGRVPWVRLLPGAVFIGLGLVGLRLAATVVLSPAITSHYRQYGPLGIVFVLLSWFVAFGVVMLGGALVGHFVAMSRPPARPAPPPAASPRADEVADEGLGECRDEPSAPGAPIAPVPEGGPWHRGG